MEPFAEVVVTLRRAAVAWLVGCGALAGVGCADVCEQVGRSRQELAARQGEGAAPHVTAVIPFELVNTMIQPEVQRLGSRPVSLGGAGMLGQFLGDATARVLDVSVGPGPAGYLGVSVVVGIEWHGQRLFRLTVEARIRPAFDPESRRLVAALGAEDLTSATPTLDEGAAERLASALGAGLPPMARGLLGPGVVTAVASSMAQAVLTETWPSIRGWVAEQLGPLARLEAEVPDLPLQRIELTSTEGAPERGLVLSLWTSLPVRSGEVAPEPPAPPAGGETIALVAHGATIAELGNWAMAEGRLPSRYNRDGQPDPEGELEATVLWRGGARPLEAHLFRTERPCARVVLGATPSLSVEGGQLRVEVTDGHLESVDGEAIVQVGALLTGMWTRAFELSDEMAGGARLTVAGQPLDAELTSISRDGDLFHATARLSPVRGE